MRVLDGYCRELVASGGYRLLATGCWLQGGGYKMLLAGCLLQTLGGEC